MVDNKNQVVARMGAIPKYVWILLLIVTVGVFLRTYHLTAWLQFSPDQARDAMLIDAVLSGKADLPLSGPQAGNTQFSLGPLYYYGQYVSGLVFGSTPQAMAYPDVLFSILAIPLLFFFSRRYFAVETSLALTALMGVSYFALINARFASNPNTIPFFLMIFLYGLLMMMEGRQQRWWLGPLAAGSGLGVGIQLHTLLLFGMPATAFLVLGWLWRKKRWSWRGVFVAVACVLVLNTGQIIHEVKTNGQSMRALVGGVSDTSKGGGSSKLLRNIGLITACEIQANAFSISSVEHIESCGGMFDVVHVIAQNKAAHRGILWDGVFIFGMIVSVVFSMGGAVLWWRAYRLTTNERRKHFLGLLAVFNGILFLVFVPVASQVSVRYFTVLYFVPFVLLGLWFDFIQEKWAKRGQCVNRVLLALLLIGHLFVIYQVGTKLASGLGSDARNSILGEIQPMSAYILAQADPNQQTIYIAGKRTYKKRFFKPLNYLAQQSGKTLTQFDGGKKSIPFGTQIFYITKASQKKYAAGDTYQDRTVESYRKFGMIALFVLR